MIDLGPFLASRVQFDQGTGAGPRSILGASDKRTAITFFAPDTGSVTLSNDSPSAFNQGIVLSAGRPAVRLTLKENGDCVRREWFAFYTGLFSPVSWIETIG